MFKNNYVLHSLASASLHLRDTVVTLLMGTFLFTCIAYLLLRLGASVPATLGISTVGAGMLMISTYSRLHHIRYNQSLSGIILRIYTPAEIPAVLARLRVQMIRLRGNTRRLNVKTNHLRIRARGILQFAESHSNHGMASEMLDILKKLDELQVDVNKSDAKLTMIIQDIDENEDRSFYGQPHTSTFTAIVVLARSELKNVRNEQRQEMRLRAKIQLIGV